MNPEERARAERVAVIDAFRMRDEAKGRFYCQVNYFNPEYNPVGFSLDEEDNGIPIDVYFNMGGMNVSAYLADSWINIITLLDIDFICDLLSNEYLVVQEVME